MFAALHRAAATDTTVLLEGESGTGKELFARALHALSPRADGPFVAINCAAIPETLLETELFGHEKGAFTGAVARKPGKFELAHRGTLFLDEIGDLPLALQAKILRALEEKRFERVGGTASLQVDVRVVAATNRNLKAAVAARQFREDLYFRLSVFPITIPPLRERPGDIPMLARYFVDRFCRDLNKKPLDAVAGGRSRSCARIRWPGNVRELQNCIERAVILADGDTIQPRHLNLSFRRSRAGRRAAGSPWAQIDLSGTLAEVDAARDRRSRAAEDRGGAEGGRRQQGRAPPSCCRSATRRCSQKLKEHGIELTPVGYGFKPDRSSAPPSVPSPSHRRRSSSRRSPSAARSAAVRRPPSCRAASPRASAAIEMSAIGGSGPRLAISVGERLPIARRRARRAPTASSAATSMP